MARAGRAQPNRPITVRALPSGYLPLNNTAEGAADETAVTIPNSGGAPGDGFTTVTVGDATAALVFDTATAAEGTTSYRLTTGAVAAQVIALWAHQGVTRSYGRLYFRLNTGGVAHTLMRLRAAGSQVARLALSASNAVELRQGNNSTVATTTTTVSAGIWYRLEWDITAGASANGTVNLYLGNAVATLGGSSGVASATGAFGTGTIDETGFGQFVATANLDSLWLDGLNSNATGMPGPLGTPVVDGAAALSAASGLTTVAFVDMAGAAALTVASALTAAGTGTAVAGASLSATSGLMAAGIQAAVAAAVLSAATDLAAAGTATGQVAATLAAASSLTASATVAAVPGKHTAGSTRPALSAGSTRPRLLATTGP